jgi:hypothetical protein
MDMFTLDPTTTTAVDIQQLEDVKRAFVAQLTKYMSSNGRPVGKPPIMGYKELDLYNLFKEVIANGGYHSVVRNVGTWSKIWKRLSNFDPSITDSSYRLKKNYERYLLDYEYYRFPEHREQASLYSQQQNLASSTESLPRKKKATKKLEPSMPTSPSHSCSSSEEENDPEFFPKKGQKRTRSDSDLSSNNGSDEENVFALETKRPKTFFAVALHDNLLLSTYGDDDIEPAVLLLQSLKHCNHVHSCGLEVC